MTDRLNDYLAPIGKVTIASAALEEVAIRWGALLSDNDVDSHLLPAASTSAPDSSSSARKSTMSSERHWSGKRLSSIWSTNRGSELLAVTQRSGAGPR